MYYGQVGDGDVDHSGFARPEKLGNQCRPAFKCDATHPCTEPAANTAAALASGAQYFHARGDTAYAATLWSKAKSLMVYADTYRGSYASSIQDVTSFYNSHSGFYDELIGAWATLAGVANYFGDTDHDYVGKAMVSVLLKIQKG